MAKISEMLIGKPETRDLGNLEPARKLVEEYKKLVDKSVRYWEKYPSERINYRSDMMIGFFNETEGYLSLLYVHNGVHFDPKLVNIKQLNYCLHEEGLRVGKIEDPWYKDCISIFGVFIC